MNHTNPKDSFKNPCDSKQIGPIAIKSFRQFNDLIHSMRIVMIPLKSNGFHNNPGDCIWFVNDSMKLFM